MSGERYFSGFHNFSSEQGQPPNPRDNQGRPAGHEPSGGRGQFRTGAYRQRESSGTSRRERKPTFRDLFGDGNRSNKGRGGRHDRRLRASSHDRRGPGRGYGGNQAVSSDGVWGSSYEGGSGWGYEQQHQSTEGRARIGIGSSYPEPRRSEDMSPEGHSHVEDISSRHRSSLLFASARVPRPAPLPEHDENLTSRKKRKFVPGGRIDKYVKAQEFQTISLYCDVCERDFYDENAKALHDRSKDHRDNQMRMRKAEMEAAARSSVKHEENLETKSTRSVFSQKEMAAFVKEHAAKWPKSFRGWANRSIQEAKRAADEADDQSIVASVQREILFEFKHHTDNCTMMQESWGRKPAATGSHYRQTQPTVFADKVFSEKEKRKMDEERRQALLTKPISTETVERVEAGPSSTARGVPRDARTQELDSSMAATENENVESPIRKLSTENGEVTKDLVRKPDGVLLPDREVMEAPIIVSWKLSPAARFLSGFCKSSINDKVSSIYREKFPQTWKKRKPLVIQGAGSNLIAKYNDLRSAFESREFQYDFWKRSVDELISAFTERGNRVGSLKRCLQMQIDASIWRGDWHDCMVFCDQIIKFHNSNDSFEDGDGMYVGYWILSGLFKARNSRQTKINPRAGHKRMLTLVTRLRGLQRNVMDDMFVYHAYAIFKSVLFNNYYQFCHLRADPMVNMKTAGNLRRITRDIAQVVRERALVTITMLSGITNEGCYSNPSAVDLSFVIRTLGWSDESGEERVSKARSFIEGLPQGIRVDDTYPELMMLLANSNEATLQCSETVDVETLAAVFPKIFKIRLNGAYGV